MIYMFPNVKEIIQNQLKHDFKFTHLLPPFHYI